jgi:hypothetical protein
MTSQLSQDWERLYGHPVYFAETFIDPGRFRGTCIVPPTGSFWGWTRGAAKKILRKSRIVRSRKCWVWGARLESGGTAVSFSTGSFLKVCNTVRKESHERRACLVD